MCGSCLSDARNSGSEVIVKQESFLKIYDGAKISSGYSWRWVLYQESTRWRLP